MEERANESLGGFTNVVDRENESPGGFTHVVEVATESPGGFTSVVERANESSRGSSGFRGGCDVWETGFSISASLSRAFGAGLSRKRARP